MNNATLKKLSEMLGISISTVSRALKDHPDISDKTKLRVRELADALDYEPNTNAIHLRTSKNNLFGLIVPSVANFFYDSFIAAVEEECRKSGYTLLILQSGDDSRSEQDSVKLCRQNRVAGVFTCLTSGNTNIDLYKKLKNTGVPVIFFDKVPDDNEEIKVCMADAGSAIIAAGTIVEKNKKKLLALFGNPGLSITKKREKAFLEVTGNNLQVLVHHVDNPEEAKAVTAAALQQQPDSLFCMSDEILTGAMKAVLEAGLKVPDDIAVITISNGFIPKLYHPDITYVETSGYKLGKLAFTTMMENIAGDQAPKELIVESVLVPGGSI
ncbi:MAG TPA: LacI family DNA-binding transcriptional regulator [Ferruginibacter sp.]|nr:LacI family DNA-binding transcriptional regulator [Ferruginibacter sp.]HPH91046.1 LacI family DNA-binding transcriptional regulator [Ferruginibacter sp.]